YAEAIKWYRLAVEQGLALAQNNLGICYANGHGVTQDYTEAVKWTKLAAKQNLPIAIETLKRLEEIQQNIQ
ncbi:MAG: tetratricopeptide repeat protein, partial [Mucinivorans sp.]